MLFLTITLLIRVSYLLRGPGGAAKSCDALLTRVERNDATLQELVILSNKTFGAAEVERLAAALGKRNVLSSVQKCTTQ